MIILKLFYSKFYRELQKVKSKERLSERDRNEKKKNQETEQEQRSIGNMAKFFVGWICLSLVHAIGTLITITHIKSTQEGKSYTVYLQDTLCIFIAVLSSCLRYQ